MTAYDQFDVVVVPFPYTDGPQTKKRPALILSSSKFNQKTGHSVCAMITSQKNQAWPLDVIVSDLKSAGLPAPSVVRMKIFTLDNRLILRKAGTLNPKDLDLVEQNLKETLSF